MDTDARARMRTGNEGNASTDTKVQIRAGPGLNKGDTDKRAGKRKEQEWG